MNFCLDWLLQCFHGIEESSMCFYFSVLSFVGTENTGKILQLELGSVSRSSLYCRVSYQNVSGIANLVIEIYHPVPRRFCAADGNDKCW